MSCNHCYNVSSCKSGKKIARSTAAINSIFLNGRRLAIKNDAKYMTKFLDKIIVMRFTFKKILNLLVVSYLTRENDMSLSDFNKLWICYSENLR